MYSNTVWKHLRDPQNRGVLSNPDGIGESKFAKCGDHLIVQLKIEEGRIQDIQFLAKACAPVVAVASLATTQLVGMAPDDARKLSVIRLDKDIGGLPGPKRHALWMFLEALFLALDQAAGLNPTMETQEGNDNEVQTEI